MASPGIGLLHAGFTAAGLGYDMNNPVVVWATLLLMDAWHWTSLVVLLCYAGLRAFLTPIIRRRGSTVLAPGRSSATFSFRSCGLSC